MGERRDGFTLIELVVATMILSVLTLMALPLARVTIKRQQERQLRRALWEMRDAIDRYKEAGDRGAFQIQVDTNGYPPTLDDLVKGVDTQGKKTRFLRRIPVDPMTGTTDWGLRSIQDDPDSDSGLAHPFTKFLTELPRPSRGFCGRVGLAAGLQSARMHIKGAGPALPFL